MHLPEFPPIYPGINQTLSAIDTAKGDELWFLLTHLSATLGNTGRTIEADGIRWLVNNQRAPGRTEHGEPGYDFLIASVSSLSPNLPHILPASLFQSELERPDGSPASSLFYVGFEPSRVSVAYMAAAAAFVRRLGQVPLNRNVTSIPSPPAMWR